MAKIVLDTNIIVRAVASPSGLASELLRRTISDGNLLCTSNFMLAELDRVLRYPRVKKIHGLSDTEIEDFVRSISLSAHSEINFPEFFRSHSAASAFRSGFRNSP
jgi:putative PIN family toxin of toxin-antitoxin system